MADYNIDRIKLNPRTPVVDPNWPGGIRASMGTLDSGGANQTVFGATSENPEFHTIPPMLPPPVKNVTWDEYDFPKTSENPYRDVPTNSGD